MATNGLLGIVPLLSTPLGPHDSSTTADLGSHAGTLPIGANQLLGTSHR